VQAVNFEDVLAWAEERNAIVSPGQTHEGVSLRSAWS
jgi:hypothetical protein